MIRAPEFPAAAQWLNTPQPLNLSQLKGYVILLDFWTYCCINCIHILPDLAEIENQFAGKPVAVIGVHAAKFLNEQDPRNIRSAIERYEIQHPVVIDNQHQIWNEYAVRAWPSFVVIDSEGYIRGQASGEGYKHGLIKAINQLLDEGQKKGSLSKEPLSLLNKPKPNKSTLSFPGKICFDDKAKRIFISDSNHNRVVIAELNSPTEAKILHEIGTGKSGLKDGESDEAEFNHPQGLTYNEGTLYICDTENHVIRAVEVGEDSKFKKLGRVSTIAGFGQQAGYREMGGVATESALNSPWDVVFSEDTLLIAMAGSHQLWQLDLNTQQLSVLAGNGYENIVDGPRLEAQLAQPSGISKAGSKVYFADSEVSAIRCLDLKTEYVETLVGEGLFTFGHEDGSFGQALLQHPLGVWAGENELYVADTYNHAIRHFDLTKKHVVTVLKAESHQSCKIGDKSCEVLPLFEPNDIKKVGEYLYIADTNNHLIRVFDLKREELKTLELS